MMQRDHDAIGDTTENENDPHQRREEEQVRLEANPSLLAAPQKEEDPHHFPTKLHRMLVEIDGNPKHEGMREIVSWQPHGRCFIIRNEKRFIDTVMPHFFRVIKFSSFRRQLHLFGFRKLSRQGPDKGAYFHEQFVRDKPEMAAGMKPVKGQGKRGRKPRSEDLDAAFYAQRNISLAHAGRQEGGNDAATSRQELKQAEGTSVPAVAADNFLPRRLPNSDVLHNDSIATRFPNALELRQFESLTAQRPQYQLNEANFPAVDLPLQPYGGGMTLPNTFLSPSTTTEGDVEPLPMQGSTTRGFPSGRANPPGFFGQPRPQGQPLLASNQEQLRGGIGESNATQNAFIQQQQMQFDPQFLQQRLLLEQTMGTEHAPGQPLMDFSQQGQPVVEDQGASHFNNDLGSFLHHQQQMQQQIQQQYIPLQQQQQLLQQQSLEHQSMYLQGQQMLQLQQQQQRQQQQNRQQQSYLDPSQPSFAQDPEQQGNNDF